MVQEPLNVVQERQKKSFADDLASQTPLG